MVNVFSLNNHKITFKYEKWPYWFWKQVEEWINTCSALSTQDTCRHALKFHNVVYNYVVKKFSVKQMLNLKAFCWKVNVIGCHGYICWNSLVLAKVVHGKQRSLESEMEQNNLFDSGFCRPNGLAKVICAISDGPFVA